MGIFRRISNFLKDVQSEFKRVAWDLSAQSVSDMELSNQVFHGFGKAQVNHTQVDGYHYGNKADHTRRPR